MERDFSARSLCSSMTAFLETCTDLASGGEYDSKSGFAAHHAFVSFGDAFQREDFVHGTHAAEDAERERLLRIYRRAGIPALDGPASADEQQGRNLHGWRSADDHQRAV